MKKQRIGIVGDGLAGLMTALALNDLPTLSSSFNFSKMTIYESAVKPIDTITPAIPAKVSVYH